MCKTATAIATSSLQCLFGSVTAVVDVGMASQGGNPWRSFIMRFFKYLGITWRHHGSVYGAIAQRIPHDSLIPSRKAQCGIFIPGPLDICLLW
ncbi:uncharacterized protein F4812DRAFT_153580 [Daldinia caldariorum]|uniref:uncharacterized protein n=1 Tax=Daldinia caldariorum TaxID=326644 RepID=UPI0020075AFF|nr:uncharacterized protein F4812DRAFT_153580 [Daldinia caldariorum]KAI1464764.1 hypothetical protein F4812DRAFT_153580 [Daldinia caldariorum]